MSKMNETELRRCLDLLAGVDPSREATCRALNRVRQTLDQAQTQPNSRVVGLWRRLAGVRTAELAAAAMLAVGYVMLVSIPSARAVTLAQVREALQKAGNVCIASLLPDAPDPRQKEWVSRSLNLRVFEARRAGRDVYALWNMSDRTIRIRPVDEEEIEVIQMSDEVFARGRQRMTHATGLVALDEIANLPEGSTWEKVDDPNATAQAPGTQAYDLVWTEPVPTIPPTRKTERFRFFVDPQSHLPSRLEMYSQDPGEPQPRWYKTLIMTYPTDQEMQALVRTLFPDVITDTADFRP